MSSRQLTSGEKDLVTKVFGDAINLDKVRIIHESYLPFESQQNNTAMAPDGNIYFSKDSVIYSNDYSEEAVRLRGLFIHEMTHVWQHQIGVNVLAEGLIEQTVGRVFGDPYEYGYLSGDRPFSSYNIEQQGDIIRDYYLMRFELGQHPVYAPIQNYKNILPFAVKCFLKGTEILLGNGDSISIERVKPGMLVASFDVKSQSDRLVVRQVKRVFVNETKYIIDLRGLKCTPGHIFLSMKPKNKNLRKFATIVSILREDDALIEQDGVMIRARTGASIDSKMDVVVLVSYRCTEKFINHGRTRYARVRAGIPMPPTILADGATRASTGTLLGHLEDHGLTILPDGSLCMPDGTHRAACNWPEGSTPFDTHESRNWIVEADGQPYTPPWIRDLVEEDEQQGLRVVGALPTISTTAAPARLP